MNPGLARARRLPRVVLLAALGLGARLHAQFAEPSVAILLESSIGAPSNLFGWAAVGLGDVDGDGVLDLAVAAPFTTVAGRSSAGRVHVLSGADGRTLWSRAETRTSAILGYALESMDWNGDGVLDLVAGAPFATSGRVWIFDGRDGQTLAELVGPAPGSGFGASVAPGGDFDGDGRPDLAVAAPFLANTTGTGLGTVQVFARGTSVPFAEIPGLVMEGQLGLGLAFVGDVTRPPDGRDELVVGQRDPASFFDGLASVHGWDGSGVVQRYAVTGVGMGPDLLGDRIDAGMDVNGDGVPDFLVGDLFHSELEVFSGADGSRLHALSAPGALGAARFVTDVDGDGRADLAVGAWQDGSAAPDAGRVYVHSGATGALLRTITSTTSERNLGIDVRELGDLNGDGRSDLLVGAYGDGFGGPLAGSVLVLSGHLAAPANRLWPAELASDPLLFDVGGDPTAGPLIGTPLEPFDLALDCRNAPAPGPFVIEVRAGLRPAPLGSSLGALWLQGPVLYSCAGTHAQDVVRCLPGNGLVLPRWPILVGLTYHVQALAGGRLSSALTQTVGP